MSRFDPSISRTVSDCPNHSPTELPTNKNKIDNCGSAIKNDSVRRNEPVKTDIWNNRVASLLKKKSTLFLTSLVMITWCQIKFYVEIVQFTNHLITSRFISSSLLQDFSLSEILETFQEIKIKNKTNVKIFVWRCEEGGGWDFPPNLPHVQGPDLSNKGNCSFLKSACLLLSKISQKQPFQLRCFHV